MVEVLLSIVILTLGVLGMVGMQAASIQSNREARLHSVATSYARELADLMRGNRVIAAQTINNPYIFNSSSPLNPTTSNYCLSVSATSLCTDNTILAQAQMTDWLQRIDTEIPGARVSICLDSAPFDATGLAVWNCTAGANAVMVIKIGWTQTSTNKSLTGSAALIRATNPSIIFYV
jgi:type IV pilus assembly protein PilV